MTGDWVFGIGGSRLNATGRCIFAMRVTNELSFDDYWADPVYAAKKPVRNGSKKMLVGDNIYHHDSEGAWQQEDSHHSRDDGTPDAYNVKRDTSTNRVLISTHFFYFGDNAPAIPPDLLEAIAYKNVRSHRRFPLAAVMPVINWLETTFSDLLNRVSGRPFDFAHSAHRYSVADNRIR